MQWLYRLLTKQKIKKALIIAESKVESRFPALHSALLLKFKIWLKKNGQKITEFKIDYENLNWDYEKNLNADDKPLVSIIVPNYNHEEYLRERLDSVYGQTYKNYEVILLDDLSSDNSRDILLEYANKYPDKTATIFNNENGGGVFNQWRKGIQHAKGKYIWIAESDDYCTDNFLSELVPLLSFDSCMLAFTRSIFVKNGEQIWSTEEYLYDMPEFNWNESFSISAHMAVRMGFAQKNIIPNVSSVVFRNIGEIPEDVIEIWKDIKLCGDWIFYLSLMRGGTIAYNNKAINYYRIHDQSTSLKVQHGMTYYKEFEKVSKFVVSHYDVPFEVFFTVRDNLKKHYRSINNIDDAEVIDEYYDLNKIQEYAVNRTPNILMCCFSMQMGGGELYPLHLANEMKRQGLAVTVLDFCMDDYDKKVREILKPNVPLIEIKSLGYLMRIIYLMGGDIIHTHHASVDNAVSQWLMNNTVNCKHIVSLHGMYEAIHLEDAQRVISNVIKTCSCFIYIADKNLNRFEEFNCRERIKAVKMCNGLPKTKTTPILRGEIGIEDDAFVLCLVSRGIAEKGWLEAVNAVNKANELSERPIHLILVGDGEAKVKIEKNHSRYIHVMGRQSNACDYFAAADVGFLPSKFRGESFPLVVIESLLCDRPVIATDIGEVRNQLTDEEGNIAGEIIALNDWEIDTDLLSSIIAGLANDDEKYYELKSRVKSAALKFDITNIVKDHLEIYRQAMQRGYENEE